MPAGVSTVASPVGGLNAYDSIAGMPETDAISLINWYPQVYGCYMRRGTRVHVDGLQSEISGTIVSWSASDGGSKLYVFNGGNMYDVTSTAAAPTTPVVSGLSTDTWEYTQLSNSAGSHLILVSGQDDPIWVHGTPVAYDRITTTDWTGSGVTNTSLVDLTLHQKRVWAVEKLSTRGWYLPAEQANGAWTKFDFGPLFSHGGYLQSLATWTVDSGSGMDDLLVAISSEGDIAVYGGIDPSSSTGDWVLKGVFYAGKPVSGRRFWDKVGGDLKMITQQGLVSLKALINAKDEANSAQNTVEARNVQQPLSDIATLLSDLAGWELKFISTLNMLLVNVPSIDQTGPSQFVENVVNGKWCEFQGWRAVSFAEYNGLPYFLDDSGHVMQGWVGHTDNLNIFTGHSGDKIEAIVQQAYSYYGLPAVSKQVGMYRPNFLVVGDVEYGSAIAYNFEFKTPVFGFIPSLFKVARWNIALWGQDRWSGSLRSQRQWEQGVGMGFAGSLCMIARSGSEVTWVSTDYTINTSTAVF
jgi:hypothetical protein